MSGPADPIVPGAQTGPADGKPMPVGAGALDAVGLGLVVRDLTVRLDAPPLPDTKVRAREFAETGGGPVPTALVTLARLGRRAAFLGVVGGDAAGTFLLDDLRRAGVETSGVRVEAGMTTPASAILVEGEGRRTVCEWRQADLPYGAADLAASEAALDAARMLLVDARLPGPQIDAARRVRRRGGYVMLDCGHPRPGAEALLAECDVAILSSSYPRTLHGEGYDPAAFLAGIRAAMPAGGLRIAGVTLGPSGCLIAAGDGVPAYVPGHRVEAIDSTGAGDVFHGAFAHALLGGEDPLAAARFANAAAAMKCRGLTGRAPLPPEPEIRRLAGLPQR